MLRFTPPPNSNCKPLTTNLINSMKERRFSNIILEAKRFILLTVLILFPILVISQNWCEFINKVQAYQNSVKLNRRSPNNEIDSATFNLDTYINFFDKLQLEPNKKHFLSYLDGGLGGEPHLFIANKDFNLDNYLDQKVPYRWWRSKFREQELKWIERHNFLFDSSNQARLNLTPVNTEVGLLQYLFFYQFGEQFALFWHSNYDEKYVVCSKDQIKKIIKEYSENEIFSSDKFELKRLEEMNPEIHIELKEDLAIITWIECETHWGIFKKTYSINRSSPYNVCKLTEEKLATFSPNFFY